MGIIDWLFEHKIIDDILVWFFFFKLSMIGMSMSMSMNSYVDFLKIVQN